MKDIPRNVSESVRRRNPALYGGPTVEGIPRAVLDEAAKQLSKPPRRIRQSTKPLLNNLEQEWFACLQVRNPSHASSMYPQSIRFKLGNGIWYKPDIWCPTLGTWGCCWEVKGPHSFRGGMENLKVVANKYPNLKFVLVWKENGKWQEQEVLP